MYGTILKHECKDSLHVRGFLLPVSVFGYDTRSSVHPLFYQATVLSGQPPVTCTIVSRQLRLFGHIAWADPSQDHSGALQAAINRLPTNWRRRRGRPRRTWLRTIESDLQQTNLGLNSAWLRAQLWRRLCSPLGVPPDDDDDWLHSWLS